MRSRQAAIVAEFPASPGLVRDCQQLRTRPRCAYPVRPRPAGNSSRRQPVRAGPSTGPPNAAGTIAACNRRCRAPGECFGGTCSRTGSVRVRHAERHHWTMSWRSTSSRPAVSSVAGKVRGRIVDRVSGQDGEGVPASEAHAKQVSPIVLTWGVSQIASRKNTRCCRRGGRARSAQGLMGHGSAPMRSGDLGERTGYPWRTFLKTCSCLASPAAN